jgi:nucleoside-triphosphatase THEP1
MCVTPSAPAHELSLPHDRPVVAIVYANEIYPDALFKTLVQRFRTLGLTLAGVLQHQGCDGGERRCDLILEDLATGHRTALFEDRGAGARGCRMDKGALAEATARVEGSLENAPQLLVLNKFGKVECEGGGLRDLIASAIDREIPVVIGVPRCNLAAWRDFAGEFAVELPDHAREVERWLDVVCGSVELERIGSPRNRM